MESFSNDIRTININDLFGSKAELEVADNKSVCLEILDEFVEICKKYECTYYLGYGTLLGAARHRGFIPWDDDIDVLMPRKDFERIKKILLAQNEEDYHIQCAENDPGFINLFYKFVKTGAICETEEANEMNYKFHELWIDVFPLDETPGSKTITYRLAWNWIKMLRRITYIKINMNTEKMSWRGKVMHYLFKPIPRDVLLKLASYIMQIWSEGGYFTSFCGGYELVQETFPKTWFEATTQLQFENKLYSVPIKWHNILTQTYGDYMILPPESERKGRHQVFVKTKD